MAARTPRRNFATPFVVTLAAIPACHKQPATPPSSAPTPSAPTEAAPAPVVSNPPPPQASRPELGMVWTISKNDRGCEAIVKVECPPGAACNPPPPTPYACPEGIVAYPVDVTSYGEKCALAAPPMHCPPHAMCNPPPPREVPCPK